MSCYSHSYTTVIRASVWDIFYHIKVGNDSFELLISHSKKLLGITGDLDTWRESSYSRFLRFCSRYTLSQVHCYLKRYIQTESYSQAKHMQFFSSFTREFEARHGSDRIIFDTARSGGPFLTNILQLSNDHLRHYWKTGTVSHSFADIEAATFINPTFVFSESFASALTGDRCTMHYATYPLQGFHLASSFVTLPPSEDITVERLVSCARAEFQEWCTTFKATMASAQQTVIIRLCTGDAVSFCQRLTQLRNGPAQYVCLFVSPWTSAELVLNSEDYENTMAPNAPTSFDTIDSSNLADHVGLLNVIIPTVPLLAPGPISTLYTDIVVEKVRQDKASNFTNLLCANIPVLGLLLGISPVDYITRFTSTSKMHDIILPSSSYRDRITWKWPYPTDFHVTGGDVIIPEFADPVGLANILYSIYEQMFADEDIWSGSRVPRDIVHYNRGTFAALLAFVKCRVKSDWTAVMHHIFDRLHADRKLILSSNNYQELCCQLYLRGVYCAEALGPQRTPVDRRAGPFKGWKEVPPVVCITLVIPRKKLRILEGTKFGSVMFQCNVRGSKFHNIFSCIQAALGTPSFQGSGSDGQVCIAEDAAGWSGTSPLVISVFVPAFNLVCDDPRSTQISLGLHSTPATAALLVGHDLGPRLTLFTANVMETSAVHITVNRPNRAPSPLTPTPLTSSSLGKQVIVTLNGSRPSTLNARWEMKSGEEKVILKKGKVNHKQVSPCLINVSVDAIQKNVVFPFSVDGTRAKIRVARKSGWIEVEVPVQADTCVSDFTNTSVLDQQGLPVVWDIHRVNLSSFPLIEGKRRHDRLASTIKAHCLLSFSDHEYALYEEKKGNLLGRMKETILRFFLEIIASTEPQVFLLSNPESGGDYAVVYCNGIRVDLAAQTFVVDACILPVTDSLRGPLAEKLAQLSSQGIPIETQADEVEAWKHLLVTFTERCRPWSHGLNCRYSCAGDFRNLLCGCGEGIELGNLSLNPDWKEFAPLMTRAAISPLFAIAYLEPVAKHFASGWNSDSRKVDKRNCAACHKTETTTSKLLKCGGCKVIEYCGKDCQMGHWKEHRKVCRAKQKI
ncbi:hypothetical protein C8R43DRAFT_935355 [Mycena crocata]|nr:hypothetical protein C8R43DRAFT_935355 [Mycena crocata]